MATESEINNIAVLGNACHLVSEIILNVAGNEITNHLDGKEINSNVVNGIALATFNRELSGAEQ
jgi:hypothetical protein